MRARFLLFVEECSGKHLENSADSYGNKMAGKLKALHGSKLTLKRRQLSHSSKVLKSREEVLVS